MGICGSSPSKEDDVKQDALAEKKAVYFAGPTNESPRIPSEHLSQFAGASQVLKTVLLDNTKQEGLTIQTDRWRSVTTKGTLSPVAYDGPATMHGGGCETSALEALGVNVDNGHSHIEEVKQIIRTGNLLGTGSFGSVYEGEIDGISVAVKVLRYRQVDSIRDELLASMSLQHINLVQTYMAFQHVVGAEGAEAAQDDGDDDPFAEMMTLDVWKGQTEASSDEGPQDADWELNVNADYDNEPKDNEQVLECFIVQECANLGNLQTLIEDGSVSGAKHLKRSLMMALDMARGLAYMHSYKVLHLDLKPQNILLSRKKGQRPVCKIADFGLSRAMTTDMATVNTKRCGTAVYAPIEMVMEGRVSPTADVYSMAIMIGEMLTGKLLYSDISMAQAIVAVVHHGMRPQLEDWVPESLRTLLQRSWSSERKNRPLAKELAAQLRSIIKNLPAS